MSSVKPIDEFENFHMKRAYLLLSALLMLLASCNSKPEIDVIAEELCDCLRPMIEMYNELENAPDPETMETAMDELTRLADESQDCADNMTEKYGDLANRQQEVDEAMARACPDVVDRLNEFQ